MQKIGIFFICAGRYRIFWPPFFEGAERYLFADPTQYEKHYFVLSDGEIPSHERVHLTQIEHEAWPFPTLKRWHYFLRALEQHPEQKMDYLYFFNATLSIVKPVRKELLPQSKKTLVFNNHPSWPPHISPEALPYERNPASLAYIPKGQGSHYFMGGLLGGTNSAFQEMCLELRQRTERDLAKNIIPVWHDESHLNRYALDHSEKITILPHTTTSIEKRDGSLQGKPDEGAIVILEKMRPRWGGHAWLRGRLPNRITVKITGGLGNQLWQYIAGLALQAKHLAEGISVELYLDTTWFATQRERKFLLPKLISKQKLGKAKPGYPIYTQKFDFDPEFLHLPPAVVLEGFFQHYRYFELAAKQLRSQLQVSPLSPQLQNVSGKYQLVALHLRRGDYLGLQQVHGDTPLSYYRAALREIHKQVQNPYILLFSDDVPWLTKHLVPAIEALQLPYSFPNGTALSDFSAMAQCCHFIITNSSYSALAALLGAKSASLVLMPRLWHLSLNVCSKQFLPPTWQTPEYNLYETPAPEKPAISLIIPVYNIEAYLACCLDSVCRQTEQNMEIIVVDDASPDNSWQLIADYAARDTRIRAIRHEQNKHLGGARNTGIEVARGEWLFFLDSDDYLHLETLEILLSAAEEAEENLELIIFGAWQVLLDGQLREFRRVPDEPKLLYDTFQEYCAGNIFVGAWGKLWKRSLFEHFRFPEHMSMEDLAMTPCLFAQLQRNKTLVLPQRLYFYRYREDSLTIQYTEQTGIDYGRAFAILEEFATQLAPERRRLLEAKIQKELEATVVRRKNESPEFQRSLIEHVDAELISRTLWDFSDQLRRDRWYRFGRMSRKRKLWAIARVLSKKLRVYKLLRPTAKFIKRMLWKA